MLQINRASLISLLPRCIIEAIENEKLGDKEICVVSKLIVKVVQGTVKAWTNGLLKQVDPNPGDGGCQLRGYLHLPTLW